MNVGAILPIVAMLAIFYFLLMRPQQKQQQQFRAMIAAVKRGDEILTTGGIKAKVTRAIDDKDLEIEIAPDVKVRLTRTGIAAVLNAKDAPAPAAPKKEKKKAKASAKKEETKGDVLEVPTTEVAATEAEETSENK